MKVMFVRVTPSRQLVLARSKKNVAIVYMMHGQKGSSKRGVGGRKRTMKRKGRKGTKSRKVGGKKSRKGRKGRKSRKSRKH